MNIHLSELDFIRFGVVTAKAKIEKGDRIDELVYQAEVMGVRFLVVRLSTNEVALCQQLEEAGAFLTDTLVYFQKNKIEKQEITFDSGYAAREGGAEDAAQLEQVAASSFRGYLGHYHADPHLTQADCDDVYSSWARSSCFEGPLADSVILIKKDTEIAAFATLKKIGNSDFEGVLFGVAPRHQGKGMHLNLLRLSENWGIKNNLQRFVSSTQINNVRVQRNWCYSGMQPFESFYTFHLWINNDSL
jgi:hypothetical protein